MEDDPSARQEFELSVEVQRSDITLTASDIQLEADGVVGNASAIKDGDTVTVLVEVTNSGIADADDVQVEIFYYPKKAPEDQDDIDNLINKGFDLDEGKNTYIYSLCHLYQSDAADDKQCGDLGGLPLIQQRQRPTYTQRIRLDRRLPLTPQQNTHHRQR